MTVRFQPCSNGTIDVSQVERDITLGQDFLDSMNDFVLYFQVRISLLPSVHVLIRKLGKIQATWISCVCWTLLMICLFSTASYLHLAELSTAMQSLKDPHDETDLTSDSAGAADAHHALGATEDERLIQKTYASLIRITMGLYIVFASFAGMLIFVAASGEFGGSIKYQKRNVIHV